MASKSGGKWVWKKRDDGLTATNWVEQTRGHSMLSIEAVKSKMREMVSPCSGQGRGHYLCF